MALIKCSECSTEVSSKAEACPKCGAPIAGKAETIAAGTQIKTVQETSKKFKIQSLLSVTLFIVSVTVGVKLEDPTGVDSDTYQICIWLAAIAFFWYIINKFRIWWHHK